MTTQTETAQFEKDFKRIIKEPKIKDIQFIIKSRFDQWLSEGQAKAVKKIVYSDKDVAFSMPTQYGKTVAIGNALAYFLFLNSLVKKEPKSIVILSNKDSNCDKIRNNMMDAVAEDPQLVDLFAENPTNDVERLKKEVSKSHIKLGDGSEVLMQAAGPNVSEENLDGDGADLIIVDESDNVPDDNFTKGIRRMKGASVESRIVQSGNCTLRNKHFMKAMEQEEDYDSFRIPWTEAINHTYGPNGEKCLTREFVMGEKRNLPPAHFKAMYECEFPDEEQSGLISYKYIREAEDRQWEKGMRSEDPIVLYGLDVAREGRDHSVLTRIEKHGSMYKVTGQKAMDIPNVQGVADKVMKLIDERDGEEYTRINVDSHGIGSGVLDILRSNGYYATGVKVGVSGRKALKRPDDFQDLKAEFYDKVRRIFEDGEIVFDGDYPTLTNELNDLETEKNTRNKIRVLDPNKSPDYADSLMLAIAVDKPRKTGGVGKTKPW